MAISNQSKEVRRYFLAIMHANRIKILTNCMKGLLLLYISHDFSHESMLQYNSDTGSYLYIQFLRSLSIDVRNS